VESTWVKGIHLLNIFFRRTGKRRLRCASRVLKRGGPEGRPGDRCGTEAKALVEANMAEVAESKRRRGAPAGVEYRDKPDGMEQPIRQRAQDEQQSGELKQPIRTKRNLNMISRGRGRRFKAASARIDHATNQAATVVPVRVKAQDRSEVDCGGSSSLQLNVCSSYNRAWLTITDVSLPLPGAFRIAGSTKSWPLRAASI